MIHFNKKELWSIRHFDMSPYECKNRFTELSTEYLNTMYIVWLHAKSLIIFPMLFTLKLASAYLYVVRRVPKMWHFVRRCSRRCIWSIWKNLQVYHQLVDTFRSWRDTLPVTYKIYDCIFSPLTLLAHDVHIINSPHDQHTRILLGTQKCSI